RMLPMTPDMSLLDRMVLAVERVRERLDRATRALETGGIEYAVIGDNAVAAWVATIDPAAVRNTPEVEILLRRADFAVAAGKLAGAGFVHSDVHGREYFFDGPVGRIRDAVHIVMAGEKVKPIHAASAPSVDECETLSTASFRVLKLEPLVCMLLAS